jgi:hypothetical protein
MIIIDPNDLPPDQKYLYNSRIEICKTCEHNYTGHCLLCGCNLLIKLRFNTEKCPVDKW